MSTLPKSAFQMLPLSRLHESPTNPRRVFDEAKLLELAASLKAQGLIQPIVARPNADGFEIVAGARRYRAAQLAELSEIPTRVVSLTDEQALEWALIENSQRVDVHPYEEAEGFQRLLDLPGYDVASLAEKTGKSESLVYARLALLQLITEVAEAFQQERITASHANLIARLPQDRQKDAFDHCWRKDWQENEAHLLPAKYLSAWIDNNVYLPLAEAPFDREDTNLNPAAGACSDCPRRSGFNTSLFSDVSGDQCMDSDCYRVKLSAHVQREVAAKPELVQIETAYRSPKERQPDTLGRNEYTDLEALREGEDDAEMTPCESSKTAIVVYGEGAGTTRTVCTDPNCPVHHPRRVVPIDPEAEARQRVFEKEQAKRKRLLKRRTESFNRILDNAPATLNGPQLRVLLRALIHTDPYDFIDDVAAHFVGDDENNQQGVEEVLNSVIDQLDDEKLPGFALRLALTGHVDVPSEGEIDHLEEAEKLLAPVQPKAAPKKPTAKAVRKLAKAKSKSAKKKAGKKVAA
jgi:ParB family chromosome partitioning protein